DLGSPSLAPPSPPASEYQPSAPAQRGGTAVFSDWAFPSTFDMLSAAAETDLRAGSLAFAPLWGLDPSLEPYPNLVREVPTLENGDVKVGADGRTMSVDVKLVKGLAWSDGQPLTAQDVLFTWEAICDPQTDAAATDGFDHVSFTVNPHYADGRSGPGAYADRLRGYLTHAPYLDKVAYKVYGSHDAMLAGLKAGETDVGFHFSAADLPELKSLNGSRTAVY